MSEIRIVGTFRQKGDRWVSVNAQRETFNQGAPLEIPPSELKRYSPFNTGSEALLGHLWFSRARAGEVWPSPDGQRLILEAAQHQIIYLRHLPNRVPKAYIQSPAGFLHDTLRFLAGITANKLTTVTVLAEYETHFILGVISGYSWVGFFSVAGTDVLEEVITRKKRNAANRSMQALKALGRASDRLKAIAPKLHEKLVYAFFLVLLAGTEETARNIPSVMAQDPAIAARAAGIITSKLGFRELNGRITASSLIWTLLQALALKAAAAVPAAAQRTVSDVTHPDAEKTGELAQKLMDISCKVGVTITPKEAIQIIGEVEAHPKEIVSVLTELRNAFQQASVNSNAGVVGSGL